MWYKQTLPNVAWGNHTRVILDVGCGVASFGGYILDKEVLTMSFAPKDEHEAQIQLALERGIPAISAVMGTQRLPFPSNVFDMVHCARCRVPWHIEGRMPDYFLFVQESYDGSFDIFLLLCRWKTSAWAQPCSKTWGIFCLVCNTSLFETCRRQEYLERLILLSW